MTQNTPLPWNSMPTQKANCCQMNIKPLVQKINQMEIKLQQQTQRREKEYNQLLRMFLTGKKEPHQEVQLLTIGDGMGRKRQMSRASRKMTSPTSRRPIIKLPLNKKNLDDEKVDETVKKDNNEEKMLDKNFSSSLSEFQTRMSACQEEMAKYQNEIGKVKELNEYLMGQLLTLFEKMKDFQQISQIYKKKANSQETVTSLVFDQENQVENIKIVNKLNNSSSRVKSDYSKAQLGQIGARVSEHEGMIADLIELTKNLSGQIKNMPPEWSISPRKQ